MEFCGFGKEQEQQLDEDGRLVKEEERRQREAGGSKGVQKVEPQEQRLTKSREEIELEGVGNVFTNDIYKMLGREAEMTPSDFKMVSRKAWLRFYPDKGTEEASATKLDTIVKFAKMLKTDDDFRLYTTSVWVARLLGHIGCVEGWALAGEYARSKLPPDERPAVTQAGLSATMRP